MPSLAIATAHSVKRLLRPAAGMLIETTLSYAKASEEKAAHCMHPSCPQLQFGPPTETCHVTDLVRWVHA